MYVIVGILVDTNLIIAIWSSHRCRMNMSYILPLRLSRLTFDLGGFGGRPEDNFCSILQVSLSDVEEPTCSEGPQHEVALRKAIGVQFNRKWDNSVGCGELHLGLGFICVVACDDHSYSWWAEARSSRGCVTATRAVWHLPRQDSSLYSGRLRTQSKLTGVRHGLVFVKEL